MPAWKSLSCFITWEIWLGRNMHIFENKPVSSLSVCCKGMPTYKECTEGKLIDAKPTKTITSMDPILYEKPLGFFYGFSIKNSLSCATGAMLFMNSHCYYKLWMCFGSSSNTMGELLALWLLIHFISSTGVDGIHVYSESKVIIEWAKNVCRVHNLHLLAWLKRTRSLINHF